MRKGRNYQAMIRTNIDGTLADRSLKLENHGDWRKVRKFRLL